MQAAPTANTPNAPLKKRSYFFALVTFGFVIGLSGCSSGEFSDLDEYLQEVRARPAGRIAPIPSFETYESFTYENRDKRDPFTPKEEATLAAGSGQGQSSGLRPDFNRHKEALENFPLDGLEFVGTLENRTQKWAIIKAPDSFVYRVKVGNHMGQNFGKVVSVDESKVQLVEIVPDGMGGWMKRDAAIAIEE